MSKQLIGMEPLEPYLTEAYCARCDSFGNTEHRPGTGMWWCNTCWDLRKPLPSSLRRIVEQIVSGKHNLYVEREP